MSRQFMREVHQDDPQNVPQNLPPSRNQANLDNKDKAPSNISQIGSAQSAEARSIFETTILESDKIIKKIDEFNQIQNKKQQDYIELQELFNQHIRANIHPTSCSNVGDFLIRNGKFVVAFIEIMARHEKKDLLKKYLYNYFGQLNKISHEKEIFDKNKEAELNRIQEKENKNKKQPPPKQGRNRLLISPDSSRNQANWSTRVEKDMNSSYRSSVLDSQYQKKSLEGLKRLDIRPPEQINQEQQRSQKIRNKKKSAKKSTTKTKQKITPIKTKSKAKSNQKVSGKSQPRELKRLQQTAIHISQQNQYEKQQKLGSCYHYELTVNPKHKHPQLTQVRASARLSQKHERPSITKQNLRKKTNSKKKSKSKSKNKQKNRKSNDEKKTKKRTGQAQQNLSDDSSFHPSDEQMSLDVQWVKDHLKQLRIQDVKMYSEFTALTSTDIKITKLLQTMQSSQEATQTMPIQAKKTKKRNSTSNKKSPQKPSQNQQKIQPNSGPQSEPIQIIETTQQNKTFQQIKQQCQIEALPLTIDYVIDPDLNNHGIYAMLKLGRVTELQMGTPYAVSPITCGLKANKRHIVQDLEKAKQIAGEYGINIAYLPMNLQIIEMIKAARNQKNSTH